MLLHVCEKWYLLPILMHWLWLCILIWFSRAACYANLGLTRCCVYLNWIIWQGSRDWEVLRLLPSVCDYRCCVLSLPSDTKCLWLQVLCVFIARWYQVSVISGVVCYHCQVIPSACECRCCVCSLPGDTKCFWLQVLCVITARWYQVSVTAGVVCGHCQMIPTVCDCRCCVWSLPGDTKCLWFQVLCVNTARWYQVSVISDVCDHCQVIPSVCDCRCCVWSLPGDTKFLWLQVLCVITARWYQVSVISGVVCYHCQVIPCVCDCRCCAWLLRQSVWLLVISRMLPLLLSRWPSSSAVSCPWDSSSCLRSAIFFHSWWILFIFLLFYLVSHKRVGPHKRVLLHLSNWPWQKHWLLLGDYVRWE